MPDKLRDEERITQLLFDALDRSHSFRFNAGAGSGKTHSLVHCINHLLKNNIERLKSNNQQIACITYTNVAVDEIKTRLGNSDIVIVSTIHEMLWSIINIFQSELVSIHLEKIKYELSKIELDLSDDPEHKLGIFTSLTDEMQDRFIELIRQTSDIYYLHKNSTAKEFRNAYSIFEDDYDQENLRLWLSNCKSFQEVAKRIYKKDRYTKCIEKIEGFDIEHREVIYDSKFNADRLDKMRFSHDTLLEYSYTLIEKYPLLRRLIIDKYPFFFIDEYQDTNEDVIKLMALVHSYSVSKNKSWCIGYFGDTAQTIYDDGVGVQIENLHKNVFAIYKQYNRRSQSQIIDVANAVRNDDIIQQPIFDERINGDVQFYYCPTLNGAQTRLSIAKNFVEKYQQEVGGYIDCLVLTNALMAEMNGFGVIYEAFKSADNIYYDDLNTKLLSHELDKLDPTIRTIYKIINSYLLIQDNTTTFYDVFGEKGRAISFYDASDFIKTLKISDPTTLGEFISFISNLHIKTPDSLPLNIYINSFLSFKYDEETDYSSIESFIKSLLKDLMIARKENNSDFEDVNIARVNEILNIPIEVWSLWVNFINKKLPGNIRYHTYHGTKGEEYNNVAIIMEHSFGRNNKGRNKFKKFFKFREQADSRTLPDPDGDDIFNTRNLIYVACSRAINNLRVLYLDDISEIEDGISKIFKKIELWRDL